MPSRGQSITLAYTAWDTVAYAGKAGDVSSHTLKWIKDGTSSAPTNSPSEVDGTNAPGIYKLTLTSAECTCDFGVLAGKSSTASVSIMPIAVSFEQLPTAAPGATNGLPQVGVAPLTNLDAAVSSRSTYAGGDTSGTTTLLTRLTSGRSANLDNLDAAISTRSSHTAANVWGVARSGNQTAGTFGEYVDAAVSTRSTYAGADTSGTTTLLARLTAQRAGYLDNLPNLDAAISTRSTYAGGDTSGTTTLLARIPGTVQPQAGDAYARIGAAGAGLTALGDTRLAHLDADISSVGGGGGLDAAGVREALGLAAANLDTQFGTIATASALTTVGGNVTTILGQTGTTGVKLLLSQAGLAPRALDAVADAALTVGDALVCAIAGTAGKESKVGTAYVVKTPNTGTVVRTFSLDDPTTPTSRS